MNNQALGTGLQVPRPGLVSEAWDIPSRPGQEAGLPLREGSRLHSPVLAERYRRLRPGPSCTEKERIPMWLRPRLFVGPGPGAGRQEPQRGAGGAAALQLPGDGVPPGGLVTQWGGSHRLHHSGRQVPQTQTNTHTHTHGHRQTHIHTDTGTPEATATTKPASTQPFTSANCSPESSWLLGRDPPLLSEFGLHASQGPDTGVLGEDRAVESGHGSRN